MTCSERQEQRGWCEWGRSQQLCSAQSFYWALGGEGISVLALNSVLSQSVYLLLLSSSPAFWKSCVPWLVFIYFLSQLNDGLPSLKSPRCWHGMGGLNSWAWSV